MNNYIELPVDKIELDKSNPRIARGVAYYGENITSETMALLLGSTSEACASLRESIRENGGIIHPIVVNKHTDGSYVVIEGNTRLQIYKDFIKNGVPGDWTKIRAIVYDNLDNDRMHAIRLQAHLIGPREWDPYSKALYLHHLANVEHMYADCWYCGSEYPQEQRRWNCRWRVLFAWRSFGNCELRQLF